MHTGESKGIIFLAPHRQNFLIERDSLNQIIFIVGAGNMLQSVGKIEGGTRPHQLISLSVKDLEGLAQCLHGNSRPNTFSLFIHRHRHIDNAKIHLGKTILSRMILLSKIEQRSLICVDCFQKSRPRAECERLTSYA
ncbi:MAG: hypothetical protein BWY75_01587 [bacterium ADurb.Bin425]|nr:MAG: hypothetical protein BWY75_01587 [bacterium ADurb.Bin425]